MAELRGIVKTLSHHRVLDGLNLHLPGGKITGLYGANGSGKSTLARIMAGLMRPDSGILDTHTLGRPVLLQQDFVIWPHLTAGENVALAGQGSHAREAGRALLARFGLSAMAEKKAGALSFGQQQRVCLARAFATDARFFLFDECLSGADATSRFALLELVAELLRERSATALWITHDWPEIAALCDHAAIIELGSVVQQGTPESIYWSPGSEHIATLTGQINLVEPAERSLLDQVLAAPISESTGAVGIRPESIELINSPVRTQFQITREWGCAPGVLQEITCTNGFAFRRFVSAVRSRPSEGAVNFLHPPCLFV